MPYSEVNSLQYSDLNPFLFADIGLEPNGMTLKVVSLFARRGCDPWREAGHLAELPKEAAEQRFADTIAAMPTGVWQGADARLIADRLLPLLPPRARNSGAGQRVHVPFLSNLSGFAWAMALGICAAAVVGWLMNWIP